MIIQGDIYFFFFFFLFFLFFFFKKPISRTKMLKLLTITSEKAWLKSELKNILHSAMHMQNQKLK